MLDMQTKFVEANGLRFEVLEEGHRRQVGALPARLSGARHLLAAPDTGGGGNGLSRLGCQSARIRAHHTADASSRLRPAASCGRCDGEKILESHRREIVVVFDLRGYTAFTETAEPEEMAVNYHSF